MSRSIVMLEISVIFEEFQLAFNFMLFFHFNTIFFSSWKMQDSKNLGGATAPPAPPVSTGLYSDLKYFCSDIFSPTAHLPWLHCFYHYFHFHQGNSKNNPFFLALPSPLEMLTTTSICTYSNSPTEPLKQVAKYLS